MSQYFALSSYSPLTLQYSYDDSITFSSNEYWFGNGMSFKEIELISNCKDFSLNNSDLMFLSKKSTNLQDVITTNVVRTIYDKIGEISVTPIHNITLGTVNLSTTNFIVTILDEDTLTIQNIAEQYLTLSGDLYSISASYGLGFESLIVNEGDKRQKFKYFAFGNDEISFFTVIKGWSVQKALTYAANPAMPFAIGSTITQSNPLTNSNIYRLLRLNTSVGTHLKIGQNALTTYDKLDESIGIDSKQNLDSSEQFLVTVPYRNVSDTGIVDFNILHLNNVKTPEGNIFKQNAREYQKILTGSNQETGFENIFLSYNSNLKEYAFKSGNVTYFHYPLEKPSISLSATDLIVSGAIAGSNPLDSDKVYKKVADYKKFTSWGDSGNVVRTGKYLCSWLYAPDNLTVPIWLDRYYQPTNVTSPDTTLYKTYKTPYNIDGDVVYSDENVFVYDVPTSLTFDSGVLYSYDRIGKNDQDLFIDNASFDLLKNVETTTGENVTVSQADTLGIINSEQFTLGLWANQQDWSNPDGDQLFGNYHNGGFGIFINNKIFNPYCSVYDLSANVVIDLNVNGGKFVRNFPTYLNKTIRKIIRLDHYSNYFILYSDFTLAEYNENNLIKNILDLPTITGSSITSLTVEIDGQKNVHILKNSNDYYKLNKDTGAIITSSLGIGKKVMWVKSDNIAYFNGNTISGNILAQTVDSVGNVFYFTDANKLYKNSTFLWNCNTNFLDIKCDVSDQIHLMYDNAHYAILDNDGNVLSYVLLDGFTRIFGQIKLSFSEVLVGGMRLSKKHIFDNLNKIVYELSEESRANTEVSSLQTTISTTLSGTEDAMLVTDFGEALLITEIKGIVGIEYTYENFGLNSDASIIETGYDWQRRFSSILDKNISVRFHIEQNALSNYAELEGIIQYDATTLKSGWHHIGVTFDAIKTNTICLYIDSILKATYQIPFGYRIKNFENYPIFAIGKNSSSNSFLSDYLNDTTSDWCFNIRKFIVKDFRVYSKVSFSEREMFYLFNNLNQKSSSNIYFNDLIWAIGLNKNRGFVEEIGKVFLHQTPGYKSNFYNLVINNFNIDDTVLKTHMESLIKNQLDDISPAHSELNEIIWRTNS